MTTVTEMIAFRVRRLVRIRAEAWRCDKAAQRDGEKRALHELSSGRSAAGALLEAYVVLAHARDTRGRVTP